MKAEIHGHPAAWPSRTLVPCRARQMPGVVRAVWALLLPALLLWPGGGRGEDPGKYASLVRRFQDQLPTGWLAEFRQHSTPAIIIRSPRMRVMSTSGQGFGREAEEGNYSITFSVLPFLPPGDYAALKARNDALHAQMGPRSMRESEHNQRLLARLVPEPDFYDDEHSYRLYIPFRPVDAADLEACRQMFQRLRALFRVYPRSLYSDPVHYELMLRKYW